MLIVFDIGNTHIVVGVFQKGKLVLNKRMESNSQRTEDETWIIIKGFLENENISQNSIQGASIVSVVPAITDIFVRLTEKYLSLKPLVINGTLDPGFNIPYKEPSQLGADRICAVAAARKKFGGPAIIVDFGTATTYDVINSKGEYLGGAIAPGVHVAGINLIENTALLQKVPFQFPAQAVGKNTKEALQSGIMYYALDGFEGMVRRLRRVAGKYTQVVATGGLAPVIMEMTNEIKYLEPNLVLEGARLIFENLTKKGKK